MKIKAIRNTRALARSLFPAWPRSRQARWVLSRLRVDSGTWRFPLGEKHIDDQESFTSLRKLPPGPPLEIPESGCDKRRKALRYVKGFVK